MRSPANAAAPGSSESRLPILVVGAIGVVFGDIGTSPLYTMREAFGYGGLLLDDAYTSFCLRFPRFSGPCWWSSRSSTWPRSPGAVYNQGQGVLLALATLALRGLRGGGATAASGDRACDGGRSAPSTATALSLPPSRCSAPSRGWKVATPAFEPYVVPIALAILCRAVPGAAARYGQCRQAFWPYNVHLVCHAGCARPVADPRASRRSASAQSHIRKSPCLPPTAGKPSWRSALLSWR